MVHATLGDVDYLEVDTPHGIVQSQLSPPHALFVLILPEYRVGAWRHREAH